MKLKKLVALALAGVLLASTALCGCGEKEIDKEATVVTINDTQVSLGFANFVARYEQAQRDQFYVAYMGDRVWESDNDGDGKTLEEDTKEDIMGLIQEWYLLEQNKDAYGVAVNDAQMAIIKETAAEFIADNTQEALDQLGATQEYVEQMLYFYVLQDLMQEAIEAKATITVTDEDAAQRTFSYIMLAGLGEKAEDGSYKYYSDAELEQKVVEAEAAVERAKADFDAVAEEYDYTGTTYSYSAEDTQMEASMLEAANALKEGEVSDLVKSANGYYVLRLDSEYDKEASDKNKVSLIAAERVAYYESVVAEYVETATITLDKQLWKNVTFDTLFTVPTEDTTAE